MICIYIAFNGAKHHYLIQTPLEIRLWSVFIITKVYINNSIDFDTAWKNWTVLDARIGGWLLDVDRTPPSFPDLLAKHSLQRNYGTLPASTDSDATNLSAMHLDLSLLGPLMVKIYMQLKVW